MLTATPAFQAPEDYSPRNSGIVRESCQQGKYVSQAVGLTTVCLAIGIVGPCSYLGVPTPGSVGVFQPTL
jgi:hypothetical protein